MLDKLATLASWLAIGILALSAISGILLIVAAVLSAMLS